MQHVRTDGSLYNEFGDPALERLTFAWYARPAPDFYSRVTVGYLERGDYNPSLALAFAIAAWFELPIDAVFSPTPFTPMSRQLYGPPDPPHRS